MKMIKVDHLRKLYGDLAVFEDFSCEFPEKKITAILGPSGCGKTTLLNILAKLVPVSGGEVGVPERISYLFQEPRLLPWLTLRQNLSLVLQGDIPSASLEEKIRQQLAAIGLSEYGDYYPGQLSGGMRQRAAMARAFAYEAPLLLMDEPFKSLDIKTRFQLMEDFRKLWQNQPRTVIMVTHDIKEAVLLGDLVLVFSNKPIMVLEKIQINLLYDEREKSREMVTYENRLLSLLIDN